MVGSPGAYLLVALYKRLVQRKKASLVMNLARKIMLDMLQEALVAVTRLEPAMGRTNVFAPVMGLGGGIDSPLFPHTGTSS